MTAVEEKLQQGNAGPAHGPVAGRVGGVIWGAFGERLGKQIGSIFAEALGDRLRVQNIGVQAGIDLVLVAAEDLMQNPSARFRTMG